MNSIRNFFTELKKDFNDLSSLYEKIIYIENPKQSK